MLNAAQKKAIAFDEETHKLFYAPIISDLVTKPDRKFIKVGMMFALVPIEKLKPESMQAYNSNVGRMMKENLMLADYFFVREKSNEGNDDSGWSISELNQYMHRESDD